MILCGSPVNCQVKSSNYCAVMQSMVNWLYYLVLKERILFNTSVLNKKYTCELILCFGKKFRSHLIEPNIWMNPYNHTPLQILSFTAQRKSINCKAYSVAYKEDIRCWKTSKQAKSLHITVSSSFIASIW